MMANHRSHSNFISKLRAILEEHLGDENFGVRELATVAGISRSNLHRKVHAYNGNSTTQFIREFRLQKAMDLLQKSDFTVAEIAYQVGYSSPTYFNTCFKEYYGYPPGEARLRTDNAGSEVDLLRNPNPLLRTREKISQLNRRLNFTKRWVVALSIGIGVIVTSATAYVIQSKENSLVNNTVSMDMVQSIAVLPLKNVSGDPELDHVCFGISQELNTKFSLLKSVRVIPRISVLQYEGSDKDAPTIAKELRVQHLLEGNVQKSGDQVKITLHLIDGPSNSYVYNHNYFWEWQSEEIFEMQSRIVEDIAERLGIEISDEELLAVEHIPTQNKKAYSLWLQGKYQFSKYSDKGFRNAITLFQEAVSLDPEFLEAHVSLAYLYFLGGASWGMFKEEEAFRNAQRHYTRALQIDSTDINAIRARNDCRYFYEWDFTIMENDPMNNSNFAYIYLMQTGRFDELLLIIDPQLEKNEVDFFNKLFKFQTLYHLNRIEEAKELLNQLEPLYDDKIMFLRIASRYCLYMGDYDTSKRLLVKLLSAFPEDRMPMVLWLSAVHAEREGNMQLTRQYLHELERKFENLESGSPGWFSVLYYSAVGDYENALDWLEKSYERHEVEMTWLREEPVLKPLRTDPRYLELYYKVGFPMPPHPN